MKRLNNFWLGFALGIIAPIAVIVGIILTGEFEGEFGDVLEYTHRVGYLSVLMRPALLANLAIFVIFFNINYMKLCRGIIIATLLFGAYMLWSFLFQ